MLQLVRTGSEDDILGAAAVVASIQTTWAELPGFWLKFEHAAGAALGEGLEAAMNRAYGENNWKSTPLVVVFFWV